MALPPAFLEELRARTPMAALVGRRVKLARSGKSWKGCCPFHGEKTPSFYVYDDGYHCFGCGAHGDAIGFVMQSEGAGFVEAVERLAAEAGLDVPKPSRAAIEAERERMDLGGVLQAAADSFVRRLWAPEGADGLAYLRGRGLTDDSIRRFGLGWSGEGRGDLIAELGRAGVEPTRLAEAGLLQARDDGQQRELFFRRVMFPIRDRRGRVISFGGRALGDAKPKYINGPETVLYNKGRTLYGLDFAREGARRSPHGVIVVEGYLDVIALHQAGFGGAVAPCGTALGPGQLEEAWRLADSPVLCFDGDAAGARAAARAADAALPLLTPQRTIQIATLPSGEDPDSLVRKHGSAAFEAVLAAKRPIAEALYALLAEGAGDSPEARAAFRARLEAAAGRIADKALSREYRSALFDRFFAARRAPRRNPAPAAPPRPGMDVAGEQQRLLLAILVNHPHLIADVGEALAGLPLPARLRSLRDALLHWHEDADALDSDHLMNHLRRLGYSDDVTGLLAGGAMPLPACALPGAMPAAASAGWWHFFELLNRSRLEGEVEAARAAFEAAPSAVAQARLVALRAALDAIAGDAHLDGADA